MVEEKRSDWLKTDCGKEVKLLLKMYTSHGLLGSGNWNETFPRDYQISYSTAQWSQKQSHKAQNHGQLIYVNQNNTDIFVKSKIQN